MTVLTRQMTRIACACVAALLTLTQTHAQQPPIEQFFDEFTAEWVRANPNLAVSTGYFSGEEQRLLEQQLTPMGPEQRRAQLERAQRGLAMLAQYDLSRLPDNLRTSAEVMQWQLQMIVDGEPFEDYDFPLQQMSGANVNLVNQLTVVHPLRSVDDMENYLLRLQQIDERMAEAIQQSRQMAERGVIPPSFILRSTLEQLQRFVSGPAQDNPLTTTLSTKTAALPGITDAQRADFAARAAAIVEQEVYPAWNNAIAVLQEQQTRATDDAGLWRFANGADIYAYQLRRYTTTHYTADQIHEIGLREVARIEAEMDRLLRQIGLTRGSIEERVNQLEERLAYSNDDAGREQIMRDIDTMIADAKVRSAGGLFDRMPKADVIAQPYPRFRWDNAAASYTAPPLDGSRPGIFQMPLRPSRLTQFALRSLVYHETVPGHHFQIALVGEDPNLPKFMQTRAFGGSAASSEGWALYAEQLANEYGWYEGDVEGLIGQLDSALFRARRLVVDTGLHAKGWTRQQAIDYGIEASEVERYVVMPGQATSYMVGQLRITELREKARTALGDRFDIAQFHNVVLGLGVVPLPVLERAVDQWISTVRTTASRPAAPATVAEWRDARALLDATGYTATTVIYDLQNDRWMAGHAELADTPALPASTFKWFSSLAALETRVIHSADEIIEWDGVTRSRPETNKDMTLREAFRISSVPHYQKLVREIGSGRMGVLLHENHYGNMNMNGGLETFWLTGDLRITPRQQIEFLRKLYAQELPFRPEVMRVVKDIALMEETASYRLYGKTGLAEVEVNGQREQTGWWTGWVERGDEVYFFATLMQATNADTSVMIPARVSVTRQILSELGALP